MTDERGFALPGIVLGLALFGLIGGTGFLVSWLEVRASGAFVAGTRAFYAADGGLSTGLATPAPLIGTTSITMGGAGNMVGAGATITYEPLIEIGPGERLVLVSSIGWASLGADTLTREVEAVAWYSDPPRAPAALTASGAIDGTGATGDISGIDLGSCGSVDVAGVATWSGAAIGPGLAVHGSPARLTPPPSMSLTGLTGVRWTDIAAGLTLAPAVDVPPDPWPSPGSGWPYVRVTGPGPLGPAETGRGALVVMGDLTLADGFAWDGLVLVAGTLNVTGAISIRGAVLAGLDSGSASSVDLGSGRVSIQYDSCEAAGAAAALVPLAAGRPGTWRERW